MCVFVDITPCYSITLCLCHRGGKSGPRRQVAVEGPVAGSLGSLRGGITGRELKCGWRRGHQGLVKHTLTRKWQNQQSQRHLLEVTTWSPSGGDNTLCEERCFCGAKAAGAISKETFCFESGELRIPDKLHPVRIRQLTEEEKILDFSRR